MGVPSDKELVVVLLGGSKIPEDTTGVSVGGDVLFVEGVILVKIPELGKEPVAFTDEDGMNTDTVVVTTAIKLLLMLAFTVGVETRAESVGLVAGMVEFNEVQLERSEVLSTVVFVNGGPVELSDMLRLALGVTLAGLSILLGVDVVPPEPELVKAGPVDDEFKLGIDATLTGAKPLLATDVLSLKNGFRSAPELVKGGPVDDEFGPEVGDALGVIELATDVELFNKDVRGASVEEDSPGVAIEATEAVEFVEGEGTPMLGVMDVDSE